MWVSRLRGRPHPAGAVREVRGPGGRLGLQRLRPPPAALPEARRGRPQQDPQGQPRLQEERVAHFLSLDSLFLLRSPTAFFVFFMSEILRWYDHDLSVDE